MIEHRMPMNQAEITQIIALLSHEIWVQRVSYPGQQPNEIRVDCRDGKSWRVENPLHFVRLKYQYRSFK
jgi:hypothetical protein